MMGTNGWPPSVDVLSALTRNLLPSTVVKAPLKERPAATRSRKDLDGFRRKEPSFTFDWGARLLA